MPVLLRSQGVAFLRADPNQPADIELGTGPCGVSTVGDPGATCDHPEQEDGPADEQGEPLADGRSATAW